MHVMEILGRHNYIFIMSEYLLLVKKLRAL